MRFAHLADLHIGKKLNGISLIEDQRYVLNQTIDLMKEHQVDALIIAGDIYQTSQPSNEAMMVFDEFLGKLVDLNMPVYMISGNHDSEEKIAYFSKLIKKSNIHTSSLFHGSTQTISVSDEYGEIDIHLLPFIKPIDVKKYYPDKTIDSYQTMMEVIFENIKLDPSKRHVLVCHQFITGGEISDSEVFAIGMLDNINHSVFDGFDYVALGHLHRPQHIGRDTIRYSGSLMKYSLSEVNSNKSMTIVDLKEKGNVSIEKYPLEPIRDLVELKGLYKDLMNMPYTEDYVSITLTDELVLPDAYLSLLTNFPNMIQYKIQKSNEVFEAQDLVDIDSKSVLDLFVDFYRGQNNDKQPTKEQLDLIRDILEELEEDEA